MNVSETGKLSPAELQSLLSRLPFLKALRDIGDDQLGALMQGSCLVELGPGETIMRRGDSGRWLYFLIRGELDVFAGEPGEEPPISRITPGELFGDLALLFDHQRRASVAASRPGRGALLFACDFQLLGDVEDFSRLNLAAKLLLYRTMVHSIRWRLEVRRMEHPQHPLVAELRRVPVFDGSRGSSDELQALLVQARFLALLLDRWNRGEGGAPTLFAAPVAESVADSVDAQVQPGGE